MVGLHLGFILAATCAAAEDAYAPLARPDEGYLGGAAPGAEGQGWNDAMRQLYYFTPQGSLLMPLDWLLALERADGPGKFVDPKHMRSFGWIYHDDADPSLNPAGLPIGFAIDPSERPEGRWSGFTCSACHTSEILAGDKPIRVDGGPANLDVDRFYTSLASAVRRTALDPDSFARFADAVLGEGAEDDDRSALHGVFVQFEARLSGDAALRHSPVAPGYGRIDALNQITNAIAVRDLRAPENIRTPDAPVSFPHLWLAPSLEWVQWNPVASNPLARNVGEVLGVFGGADLHPGPGENLQSTAIIPNLIKLEDWLRDLKPPVWPAAALGVPVDQEKAALGATLFERDCKSCHNMYPWEMTDDGAYIAGRSFIEVGRIPAVAVETDPAYLDSFRSRTAVTGHLAEAHFGGKPVVPGADYFITVVGAVVEAELAELPLTQEERLAANDFRFLTPSAPGERLNGPDPRSKPCADLACLKAGPLVAIWATGPYLHNGSVPTIYELLSPPAERRSVFWVGGQELDAEKLGFASSEGDGRFRYDTSLHGNGNGGHVFPARGYSHDERMAVIEYLKEAGVTDIGAPIDEEASKN